MSSRILAAIAVLYACSGLSAFASEHSQPNVVFILADDLGYGDVECFGGDRCQIDTPHFDRLAQEGMRFTDAHATGSVCVPSRISIMTGRYAWRFGAGDPGGPWGFLGTRLPAGQQTLGTMLKSSGYRTGYIGKWHLGTLMQTKDGKQQGPTNVDYTKPIKIGPPQYGFDESFILPGSLDMYPYAFVHNNRWVGRVTAQKGWSAFNRIGPAAEDFEDHQVLASFCDQATRFITQSVAEHKGPFFLYLALTSPHTPLSPSAAFDGKSSLGVYGDFVMETDHCIGRILTALEQNGVDNNTLVIATSDHGAASYAGRSRKATEGQLKELEQVGHYASGIYRGYKFSAYEGGFRVPFVARWPGVVRAGSTCDRLVGLHDLLATLAEIAGSELADDQAPDSISLLPLLQESKSGTTRQTMIFQATRGIVIRSGDWKLLFCPGAGCDDRWLIPNGHESAWRQAVATHGRNPRNRRELLQPAFVQLFNLAEDPAESTDLASAQFDRVRALHELYLQQVRRGRSTPGPALTNDRDNIRAFSVPPFVLERTMRAPTSGSGKQQY